MCGGAPRAASPAGDTDPDPDFRNTQASQDQNPMSVKIRLTRLGAKKSPVYRIVVANSRNARDGAYIEKIGIYNPLAAKEDPSRVVLNVERAQYWVACGAQPTDRVARFLAAAGIVTKTERNNPKKGAPKAKAQERLKEAAAARAAAEAAAAESAGAEA